MSTEERRSDFGLLPNNHWDWRTFVASYGFLVGMVALLIVYGLLTPDTLLTANYHVTELVARPALKAPNGARPVLIHTGEFQGSSVAPTVNAPIEKVQTGGFGDPNGLKPNANSKPNGKLIASSAGAFDMPVGAGNGNGSGGAKGIKGTVASADFGSGVATGGQGNGRSSGRGVQSSGFGSQITQNTPHVHLEEGPATTAVEITYKPNPVYTAEARNLKLEGEVLLEVEFTANGTLHVNRVVRGLGHGLDEAAVAAASKMRFKPAMRNGQPTDSTAVVHVVFQMAD
jgi:TonB family protein